MPGRGYKRFTREILSSADVQDFLQDQAVMRFSSVAERTAELLEPAPGMTSYVDATQRTEVYRAGGWYPLGRFLGSRSSWPDTATLAIDRGDYFYSIPHQCHMIAGASATGWAQLETPSVNGRAGVDQLYSAVLAAGMSIPNAFRVYAHGIEREYVWDRSAWQLIGGRPSNLLIGGAAFTAASGWSIYSTDPSPSYIRNHSDGYAYLRLQVTRTGASMTMNGSAAPNGEFPLATVAPWHECLDHGIFHEGRGIGLGFAVAAMLGGTVYLNHWAEPGSVLSTGSVINVQGLYRLYHASGMPV